MSSLVRTFYSKSLRNTFHIALSDVLLATLMLCFLGSLEGERRSPIRVHLLQPLEVHQFARGLSGIEGAPFEFSLNELCRDCRVRYAEDLSSRTSFSELDFAPLPLDVCGGDSPFLIERFFLFFQAGVTFQRY